MRHVTSTNFCQLSAFHRTALSLRRYSRGRRTSRAQKPWRKVRPLTYRRSRRSECRPIHFVSWRHSQSGTARTPNVSPIPFWLLRETDADRCVFAPAFSAARRGFLSRAIAQVRQLAYNLELAVLDGNFLDAAVMASLNDAVLQYRYLMLVEAVGSSCLNGFIRESHFIVMAFELVRRQAVELAIGHSRLLSSLRRFCAGAILWPRRSPIARQPSHRLLDTKARLPSAGFF